MSQPRPGANGSGAPLKEPSKPNGATGGCVAPGMNSVAKKLTAASPPAGILYVVLMSLFILKSVIEERFLRDNPEYAAYMRQVRYRWIQGVA
jgi:protein-S-isoprenylcysteine O-methyltransferase Ste14